MTVLELHMDSAEYWMGLFGLLLMGWLGASLDRIATSFERAEHYAKEEKERE